MRIGSLFTGYGGLDMALPGAVSWISEIDPAACRVLAANHPDTPNLGDVTAVDWSAVPPIDVLTAGYPCQPFSHAGKREGTNDDRHLWPYVAHAISHLRPSRIVLENVRGHLTLGFDVVLGDLARMGYGARWGVVRASDAGAPHARARLFVVAYPNGSGRTQNVIESRNVSPQAGGWAAGVANGHSADRITTDARSQGLEGCRVSTTSGDSAGPARVTSDDWATDWGKYSPAIARWERVTGRAAPAATVAGRNGRPRLSPRFTEWMMGLPDGWITGHGLTAAQSIAMCGNGVVPQQAALAVRLLGGVR